MTAEYSIANSRAELHGDGAGWQRMRRSMRAAPTGTKKALYIFQANITRETDLSEIALLWNAAAYFGLKFDSVYPTTSEAGHSDYDNFFGMASAYASDFDEAYFSVYTFDEYDSGVFGVHSNGGGRFYDGNGGAVDLDISTSSSSDGELGLPVGRPDRFLLWEVWSDPTDDRVHCRFWTSDSVLDIGSMDLDADIPGDDPKSVFSNIVNTSATIELQADVVGTNWRPETGVMAWPTWFMAGHPFRISTMELNIKYVGVQYSQQTH